MPKTQSEDNKKHGDKLEPLIERTKRESAEETRDAGAEEGSAELQDDDDEDLQNDDVEDRRDVGKRPN
jgi:hypothetical protein